MDKEKTPCVNGQAKEPIKPMEPEPKQTIKAAMANKKILPDTKIIRETPEQPHKITAEDTNKFAVKRLDFCREAIDLGMTLFPGELLRGPDGKKKFRPHFKAGFQGITDKSQLENYPKSTCWLAKSDKWIVLDDDTGQDIILKNLGLLPQPFWEVKTGTPGRFHYYFRKGKSILHTNKFIIQTEHGNIDVQTGSKGTACGWFLPGSYNQASKKYYTLSGHAQGSEPLEQKHLDDLMRAIEGKIKGTGSRGGGIKIDYKKGNRQNSFNAALHHAKTTAERDTAILNAMKSKLPVEQIAATLKQHNQTLDPGPSTPPPPHQPTKITPTHKPEKQATKQKQPKLRIIMKTKKQPQQKWLLDGFIPASAFSVWAGPTGKGRTTTLLNLLTLNATKQPIPGCYKLGDGRPFLYHGPENPLGIIQKRVRDAGGNHDDPKKSCIHFLQYKDWHPMQIPKKYLQQGFIDRIKTGIYSAVVCDPIYLLLATENEQAEDILGPIIRACQEVSTAFICIGHIKKNIKDQEIVHHIRGHSDIVTISRAVVYMREGKEAKQRVIVPVKNSWEGDLNNGFVTDMTDNDSPIKFTHHTAHAFEILKEHAKSFQSFTDAPKDAERDQTLLAIKGEFNLKGTGAWLYEDYKKFINKLLKKELSRTTLWRWLGQAGLETRQKDTKKYIFKKL